MHGHGIAVLMDTFTNINSKKNPNELFYTLEQKDDNFSLYTDNIIIIGSNKSIIT